MRMLVVSVAVLAAMSASVAAQTPGPDTVPIHTALPSPAVSGNAAPADILRAAQGALAAGRSGEAQEALEMAQTRLLDRSVQLGHTGDASGSPAVNLIRQALQALAAGDRLGCADSIQAAIGAATIEGS